MHAAVRPATSSTPVRPLRGWAWVIPVYAALTLYGTLGAQAGYSLLGLAVLVVTLLWPLLHTSARARGLGVLLGLAALACWWLGLADAVLDALPVLVNAALAALFGASLRRGHEPLIARFVRVVDGPEQLLDARVASYARGLTRVWAGVLAVQAVLLALLWLVSHLPAMAQAAALDSAHLAWLHAYARLGCYLGIAAFFVLEYGWRRWHLRHVTQVGFFTQIARIVRYWPHLLHDAGRQHT